MVTEKNAWNSGGSLAAMPNDEYDHWGQRIK